ncbi:hypothetical protein [Bartonella jaculi]|uniref:TolA protein n=1 Tax=Bartonella jaculi TaxID=686226 RepID=A0ABP9N9T7_9HYPH
MKEDSYHSMKRGLALSLAAHVLFLSWGAVHLINPVSLPQPLEAIPITLAPLAEEFSSKQGALNAPVGAIPAVKPTTKPQEKEEAHHFGEGQVDTLAPFKQDEKPRPVEATSAPSEPSLSAEEKTPEKTVSQPQVQEFLETKTQKIPEEQQEVVEKIVPEQMPVVPQQNVEKVVPEAALEEQQEVVEKIVPEAALEEQQEVVEKIVPEQMPVVPQQNVEKVVPEAALEEQQEVVEKIVPEAALEEQQEVAEKIVPEQMPVVPQQNVEKVVPEQMPVVPQQNVEKIVPEASREMRKNEEVVLPQTAHRVEKMPGEQMQIQQHPSKVALPDRSPLPQLKPKSVKQSTTQKVQTTKKQNQQMAEQTIEEILAMEDKNLFNRARTQGGGAKRSSKPEALGARKKINDTTKMAQTLVNIVGGCIQKKLKLVALGGDLKNRPVVRLRFYLNREGMVVGDPIIDPLSGEESQQSIMIRQVYAAVFSCQPYTDLPHDQYDLWGQGFDFNVDPLQEITQ